MKNIRFWKYFRTFFEFHFYQIKQFHRITKIFCKDNWKVAYILNQPSTNLLLHANWFLHYSLINFIGTKAIWLKYLLLFKIQVYISLFLWDQIIVPSQWRFSNGLTQPGAIAHSSQLYHPQNMLPFNDIFLSACSFCYPQI